MKIILLCKPEFSSATKTSFLIKNTKKATLQQVASGNTSNIVSPLKKVLQFRGRICFFFLKHKKQPLPQVSDGETANLVLKRMLEHFLKVPPFKKFEFQNQISNQKSNQ